VRRLWTSIAATQRRALTVIEQQPSPVRRLWTRRADPAVITARLLEPLSRCVLGGVEAEVADIA